jgi:hypothetical protein
MGDMIDRKWPIGGYAPGLYMCLCRKCQNRFQGEKRAYECPDCVIQRLAALPPADDAVEALVKAAEAFRQIAPKAMQALMQQGRDGLLLADEIHKADDKLRAALAAIRGGAK